MTALLHALTLAGILLVARPVVAVNHLIAIDAVLGSWQGDDTVQFVELRLLADGQGALSDGGGSRGAADLVFDDASGDPARQRVFTFTHDLMFQLSGARVLVATRALATAAGGLEPDFVLPPGMLAPRAGRVCYRVNPPQSSFQPSGVIDCVAYGKFTGDDRPFGPPTPLTPDNRSLQRTGVTGNTVADWTTVVAPTPQRNDGAGVMLPSLCGDGVVSQGEDCDGTALGGKTCASIGFAKGTLRCTQCHLDTSKCSFCGNGAINGSEECDGADVGGRTCTALGFTGGTLGCTARCRLSTATCDPTFFVPGGGPPGPECLAEWRVRNATARPGADGKAAVRQRCKDGDAGCDSEPGGGVCGFEVALCFDRDDARLMRGPAPCRRTPIESWTLLHPAANDPAAIAALAAVAALGPSSTAGTSVTFAPPLETKERCTATIHLAVPTRGGRAGTLTLRTRTAGAGGRPRDADTLRLVCAP